MKWTIGAAALCLALSLTACSSSPEVVTQTETQRVTPPAELMEPIPVPILAGKTNGALLSWALTMREALRSANAEREELREWSEEEGDEE